MKYKIAHLTTYDYSEMVPFCQNEVHLAPRNHPGQTCRYHRLIVRPAPASSSKRFDYFGNPVNYFAIHEGHRRLMVSAVSKIDLHPRPLPDPSQTPPWETVRDRLTLDHSVIGLEAYQFCFDSPLVRHSPIMEQYALESFPAGRPILAALQDLTSRIFHDFQYDPEATTVKTPLEEVFAKRRGVCQDLAHVQIACLRSLGLAARYVSGYLRTMPPPGQPRLVGADASHAWASLYCGSSGWIDADPTNNVLPLRDHVTVAWGRDYGDVCPIHGLFIGGGKHAMHVAVNVVPLSP
jgi:transglutaminase-like putative cysteine protease